MKAKDFFKELKQIENQIESKKYMAQTYRTVAEGVRSPTYSDMPKSSSRQLEPMATALMKAIELEESISSLEHELTQKQAYMIDLISNLEKNQQILLIKRYFEKRSWGAIAASMFYSERWIYKLHGIALKELDKLFSKVQ